MKVKDLKNILNRDSRHDELDVGVILQDPSMGPRAKSIVKNASFGFDWDKGLLLSTEDRLTKKGENQDAYDAAHDLLMFLATKPLKRMSYETRMAKKILTKTCNYTEEDFVKYRKFYHRTEDK